MIRFVTILSFTVSIQFISHGICFSPISGVSSKANSVISRTYFSPPQTTPAATNQASRSDSSLRGSKRENSDSLSSRLGDLVGNFFQSSLSSSGGKQFNMPSPEWEEKILSLVKDSWENIRSKLEERQTPEERSFRSNVSRGLGPPSPLNQIRLFEDKNREEDIRVTFYRDHASWCPYCQKVWITLEEKRIPYRIEKVNMRCYGEKPASFLRLQPNGNIPIAIIDGKVYNQSNDIIYALETLFPHHKRLNKYDMDSDALRAQSLMKLERSLFSVWMYWLTGRDSRGGRESFISVLKEVERELNLSKGGDFFMGGQISLVDIMFAPFLERMCASLLYYKGFQIRVAPGVSTEFPAVNKWFDAMETLESYQLTKSDYYTHCWDLPPQLGGCTYEVEGGKYKRAINGDSTLDGKRGSWELPLEPHNGGVEPDWTWCGDNDAARLEAVERLTFNHKNIVPFAARGAGQTGIPSYSAPLSDPNAKANEAVVKIVDTILRLVSLALLEGTEPWDKSMGEIAGFIVVEADDTFADGVANSLIYLRDRIGVPRDMRLPAARQLRAILNWALAHIQNAKER